MSEDDVEPTSRPAAEQPGRYQRSTSGMIGALLVTLLVIGAYVAFRALNRTDLDVKPGKVDYLAQVRYAQQAGADVVYPAHLPSGWTATQVTFSAGPPPGLELSMLTADNSYVGFVESAQSVPELLTTYVDPQPTAGASVTVAGSGATRWSTWTDGSGDTALAAQRGHGERQVSLLVFGTVTKAQLEGLAASLTTADASD
jgi:Protein of unknown function (DUF4245)